jgi:hypothetical protein
MMIKADLKVDMSKIARSIKGDFRVDIDPR